MSDWITVTGVAPWDGRYELDLDGQPLTTREWGLIKRHAGYLPLTLDAASFGDPEFMTVLAVVAVRRAGTLEDREVPGLIERLFDSPFGTTITLEAGDTADDAGPPPSSSDVRPSTNGASSTTGSESSENPLTPTGAPRSDTSASAPAMSAT